MIDSHCHLDFKHFDDKRDEIVGIAKDAGVHTILTIGIDQKTSRRAVELAEQYDNVWATVGVHPHDAKSLNDEVASELVDLAGKDRVVAIGEIGLDYYRDLSPRDVQKKAFEQQLRMAVDLNLPVVIHTRESFEDSVEIVRQFAGDLKGGVFHCFPGDADDAQTVIDLGFHISVGGVITYKNSRMADMVREVPLEHVLIETDAPFLAPFPHRGDTNQPAYVRFVRDKLAELKDVSPEEVDRVTDRNCQKLFGLVETFGG